MLLCNLSRTPVQFSKHWVFVSGSMCLRCCSMVDVQLLSEHQKLHSDQNHLLCYPSAWNHRGLHHAVAWYWSSAETCMTDACMRAHAHSLFILRMTILFCLNWSTELHYIWNQVLRCYVIFSYYKQYTILHFHTSSSFSIILSQKLYFDSIVKNAMRDITQGFHASQYSGILLRAVVSQFS